MAAAAQTASVREYLHTSYEHHPELVDGQLKERPMPTELHAWTQALLCHWFLLHMQEWNVMALPELRIRIEASRYRLPDVAVTLGRRVENQPYTDAPLVAIEILSPDDNFTDLRERAADLTTLGTKSVWLIDPEKKTACTWVRSGMDTC